MVFLKLLVLLWAGLLPLQTWAQDNGAVPLEAPASADALFEQAMGLMQAQQWGAAAELFKKISQQQPGRVEVQNNLAVALLENGDEQGAREALEQAVTASPPFKTAQQNRQRLYDYLAAKAYDQALGKSAERPRPALELLPLPVAEAPEIAPVSSGFDLIQQQVENWRQAWASGDVDAYFAVYSPTFQPQKTVASSYEAWHFSRLLKLKRADKPQIRLEDIKVYLDKEKQQAMAEFVQHYRSRHYGDTVIKQLHFVLQDGNWLIQKEHVVEQLKP